MINLCSRLVLPNLDDVQKQQLIQLPGSSLRLQELPYDYARYLSEIYSDQDLNLDSNLFLKIPQSQDLKTVNNICQLKSENGNYVILPYVPCPRLPEKCFVHATGGLLRSLQHHFGSEFQEQNYQCNIVKGKEGPDEGFDLQTANKVEIAFLGTQTYSELKSQSVDDLLKNFFSQPKYLFKNQVVQVPLNIYGGPLDRANNPDSVFFKVLNLEPQADPRLGALASVNESNLFQKSFVQEKLPFR